MPHPDWPSQDDLRTAAVGVIAGAMTFSKLFVASLDLKGIEPWMVSHARDTLCASLLRLSITILDEEIFVSEFASEKESALRYPFDVVRKIEVVLQDEGCLSAMQRTYSHARSFFEETLSSEAAACRVGFGMKRMSTKFFGHEPHTWISSTPDDDAELKALIGSVVLRDGFVSFEHTVSILFTSYDAGAEITISKRELRERTLRMWMALPAYCRRIMTMTPLERLLIEQRVFIPCTWIELWLGKMNLMATEHWEEREAMSQGGFNPQPGSLDAFMGCLIVLILLAGLVFLVVLLTE